MFSNVFPKIVPFIR